MELIYGVNEIFSEAKVCHAMPILAQSRDHAGSFDGARYLNFKERRFLQGTPGYYESTSTKTREYLYTLKKIKDESTSKRTDDDGSAYFADAKL